MNKAMFDTLLTAFPGVCREHYFAKPVCTNCQRYTKIGERDRRLWRFDWAWPDLKVAIEYEGLMSAKSRHITITGFSKDCEKYNAAALLGWQEYRFTAPMLADSRRGEKATVWRAGDTVDLISKVLKPPASGSGLPWS